MKHEVAMLTARLNAQDAAQQQASAQAQQAQATAQEASAQAAAAASQAQAAQTQVAATAAGVPAQVKTALAAVPKPAARWFDNTSISGRMYFNMSHIDQHSDGAAVARSSAFDIKRFYLGVDHKFNDIFSANLTTDVSLIANTNTVTGTANSGAAQPGQGTTAPTAFPKTVGETLYIKKAYLQAKLNPAFIIRVGAADLPWVPFVEDVYGYRYVENTLIDRTDFGTSADWGLHVLGTFADGHVSYARLRGRRRRLSQSRCARGRSTSKAGSASIIRASSPRSAAIPASAAPTPSPRSARPTMRSLRCRPGPASSPCTPPSASTPSWPIPTTSSGSAPNISTRRTGTRSPRCRRHVGRLFGCSPRTRSPTIVQHLRPLRLGEADPRPVPRRSATIITTSESPTAR